MNFESTKHFYQLKNKQIVDQLAEKLSRMDVSRGKTQRQKSSKTQPRADRKLKREVLRKIERAEKMLVAQAQGGSISRMKAQKDAALLAFHTSAMSVTEAAQSVKEFVKHLYELGTTRAQNSLVNFGLSVAGFTHSAMSGVQFLALEVVRLFVNMVPEMLAVVKTWFVSMVKFLTDLFRTPQEGQVRDPAVATAEAQGGNDDDNSAPDAAPKKMLSHIGDLCVWAATGKDREDKTFSRKLKHFGDLFRSGTFIAQGTVKVVELATWVFTELLPGLLRRLMNYFTLTGVSSSVERAEIADLGDFVLKCADLTKFDTQRFKDKEYCDDVIKTYDTAAFLSAAIIQKRIDLTPCQASAVNRAIVDVQRFYRQHQIYLKHHIPSSRPTPFSIQLVGGPGVGKSLAATTLAPTLCDPEVCPREFNVIGDSLVYARGNTKHWDNYLGEEVIQIDDICQLKSTPGDSESQAMEFIRLINTQPMITPQAAVEMKGLPAVPRLVISTTNVAFPDIAEIRDPGAYRRRRHMLVYQVRIPDICAEFLQECGTDVYDEWEEYKDWAFFNVDPIDERQLTNLTNEFTSKPLTLENVNYYREKFGLLSWPEFLRDAMDEFYEHLLKPDPVFRGKSVGPKKLSQLKNFGVHFNKMGQAERTAAIEAASVATRPETGGISFLGDYVERPLVAQSQSGFFPSRFDIPDGPNNVCCPHRGHKEEEHDVYEFCYQVLRVTHNYRYGMANMYHDTWLPPVMYDELDAMQQLTVLRAVQYGAMQFEDSRDEEYVWNNIVLNGLAHYTYPPEEDQNLVDHFYKYADQPSYYRMWSYELPQAQEGSESSEPTDPLSWWNQALSYIGAKIEWMEELIKKVPTAVWYLFAGVATLGVFAAGYKLYSMFSPCDVTNKAKILVEVDEDLKEDMEEAIKDVKCEAEFVRASAESCARKGTDLPEAMDKILAQTGHAYDDSSRSKVKPSRTVLRRATTERIVAQAFTGKLNVEEIARKVMQNNCVQVSFTRKNGEVSIQNGIMIKERYLQVTNHCVTTMRREGYPVIKVAGLSCVFENIVVDPSNIKIIDDYDRAIIKLPHQVKQFPDITKYIQSIEEEQRSNDLVYYCRVDVPSRTQYTRQTLARPKEQFDYEYDVPGEITEVIRVVQAYELFNIANSAGNCGSIAFNMITGKIIGFHVAGLKDHNKVYLSPMFKEDFDDLTFDVVVDNTKVKAEHLIINPNVQCMKAKGSIELVGQVDITYHQQPPNKNNWEPTVMNQQGDPVFEIVKEPSVMTLSDPRVDPEVQAEGRTPLQIGIDKYSSQAKPFSPETIKRAKTAVLALMNTMPLGKVGKRVLTDFETINGLLGDGIEQRPLDGMDMKTSPGLPYRYEAVKALGKTKGFPGKLPWFEPDVSGPQGEALYKIRPEINGVPLGKILLERLEKTEKEILRGEVPFYVNAINLKQETLKLSKIRAAKTRVFECQPIHINMLVRKYFCGIFETWQVNCVNYPISVGIAAQKRDWTELGNRLTRWGGKVIAGDYKSWDGLVMPDILRAAVEIVNDWYGDEQSSPVGRARLALAESHSHTYFVAINALMRRHGGMASGSPMTSPINSLCNWLNIYCAIIEILDAKGVACSTSTLIRQTELALYGDDHIVAVGPELLGLVTFKDFYRVFNEHGLGYSDSVKSDRIEFDYEDLSETTYLKRRFVKEGMFWLAPLDITSIENMALWYERRDQMREFDILIEKAESFKSELGLHTRQVYQDRVSKWNDYIRKWRDQNALTLCDSDLPLIFDTYDEVRDKIIDEIRGVH